MRHGVFFLLMLFLFACSSSSVDITGGKIETELGSPVIDKGDKTDVSCTVFDANGKKVDVKTVVKGKPEEGIKIEENSVTGIEVGKYEIWCETEDGKLKDDSPETLTVTVGGVYEVKTVLKEQTVKAGETVDVKCLFLDKDGNEVSGSSEIVTDPDNGVSVDGNSVTFTKVGEYTVFCTEKESGLSDEKGVKIKVIPGDVAKVEAKLKNSEIMAGESTEVFCTVFDAYKNEIEDFNTIVDEKEGIKVQDHTITGEKQGKYDITCSVENFDGEYEKIPDTLTVKGGTPAYVEFFAKPEKMAYKIDDKVTFSYKVYDDFDNELEGIDATINFPQNGIKKLSDTSCRFKEEGVYEFTLTLKPPYDSIKATLTLICDETPPVISDLFPERGMTFDGDPEIKVSGKVKDAIGDVSYLKVNGKKVDIKGDGTFEYLMTSKHGLNGIVIEASDEFGNKTKITRGYYYSTKYMPMENKKAKEVLISNGSMVYMTQEAIDDGDHDPSHVDDFATIAEILLSNIDFDQLLSQIPPFSYTVNDIINFDLLGLIPGVTIGLTGDLEVQVKILDITVGNPKINIDLKDGGFDTHTEFSPVSFTIELTFILHVFAGVDVPGLNWGTTLTPSVSTQSTLSVEKLKLDTSFDVSMPEGGELTVKAKDFNLELEGISIDPIEGLTVNLGTITIPAPINQTIDLGEYDLSQFVGNINDFLSNYILDPLANFLTPYLLNFLEPIVETFIGDAIAKFINMFAIEQKIELPSLFSAQSEPVAIDFATKLSSVTFTEEAVKIGLFIGTASDKKVDRNPLGSILRDSCMGNSEDAGFEFSPQPSMQIGLKYDFFNELMFAVWWTGGLNMTLGKEAFQNLGGGNIPIEDLTVETNFLLPPILDDCNSKGIQEIQVGDLALDLKFNFMGKNQHVLVWLNVRAMGGVTAYDSNIGIKIDKISYFESEIIDLGGNLGAFKSIIEGLLPSLLTMVEGKEFTFPVPSIDLHQIYPDIPQGTELKLGNLKAYNSVGVTVIGGDFL